MVTDPPNLSDRRSARGMTRPVRYPLASHRVHFDRLIASDLSPTAAPSSIHRDPTSGILVPASPEEWAVVLAHAGIASPPPDAIWQCEEASGDLADSIGEFSPTAAQGAVEGIPDVAYQEAVAGWGADGEIEQEHAAEHAAAPGAASTGDGDLDNALRHNRVELSGSIDAIMSTIAGEPEGANWHWLVLLSSGRFAYITGGCDYTGWDCKSNCEAFEADSLREVLRLVPEAHHDDVLAGLGRTRDGLDGAELAAFDELVRGATS